MFETASELISGLGLRIKRRRLAIGLTQIEAASRAGIAYRTWRRLEAEGKASIEDLVRAAIALRCEQDLGALFPEPPATSMEALLKQQKAIDAAAPRRRLRAASKKQAS